VGPTRAEPSRIAFLGFGLIAGSVARALRARGAHPSLVAWTPDGHGPRAGLADGTLDAAPTSAAAALAGAELVVLAAPPTGILGLLTDLAGPLRSALAEGATVTDVASTKTRILERADALGLPFVGGHPMAGRETSGFGAATEDLFSGRPWVIVPGAAASALDLDRATWLATVVGADPIRMTAADHDRAVAAISHLPLVVAAALVEAVAGAAGGTDAGAPAPPEDWPIAARLAASGWAGATRLARGDPAMGAGILATNADEVAGRLRDLRRVLDGWIDALDRDAPDEAGLRDRLAGARDRLEDDTP
jgi:prephenate dehydrogenase